MSDISHLPNCLAALERLEAAIGRLEALTGRLPGDNQALTSELIRSRDDYARLEEASRLVEGRLDGVINRLKTVLGE